MNKIVGRVTFALFFLFGTCYCETCDCRTYLMKVYGPGNMISSLEYDLPDLECDDNGILECKELCINMYKELTENGNLCAKVPLEERRVGDWMCEEIGRDISNETVGLYSETCKSGFIHTGFKFTDTLSCKSGLDPFC